MSARWQRVKEILLSAMERPADEREDFLDKICGEDKSLRCEVETLLVTSANVSSFMERAAIGKVAEMFVSEKNTLPIGECFNHFKVIKLIGAGGMGEVYLARDKKLDRQVALKILNEKFSRDASNLERFIREAKAASALNHPNILTIYETGECDDTHYIVSELVDGVTLRQVIEKSPLDLHEVLEIAVQTAGALGAAHSAGIVHRDIKPENVMIRPDGFVKILDFGLAKLTGQKHSLVGLEDETVKQNQTAEGIILGTSSYMSPEQAKGERVDARTDIFSFGVLIYEMMTGRTPFAGNSVSETFANLMTAEPQPLARYAEGVPDELQRIVSKTLRKNKDERYQTTKELFTDLKDLRENLRFGERLEKSYSPDSENETKQFQATTGGANLQTTQTDSSFVRQIKQQRPLALTGLIVLLAALGLGVWYFGIRPANTKQIESIAVLPFVNDSGNADNEYLSDGMTETLIGSLSQIPKLNVKARSSVFRYKGQETDVRRIAQELDVQAILTGRVVQRGDDLTLFLNLVDAATENNLWSRQYNRKNLVALQAEIARDVSDNLKTKLTGADEQKLTKNYTQNPEAYQLYLKGRYQTIKLSPQEIQKGVSYLQEAIKLDPNYALAHVGLADAYRALALGGEQPPNEYFPKAKAAANRAIEIDDTLGEAHAVLGFIIFWYDWDWAAAEKHLKRALELNPNNSDAHLAYGHFLSTLGRFDEGLAELKRARELEPLNARTTSLEVRFLANAGRLDESFAAFQKIFETDPNYWFAYAQIAIAYNNEKMYDEAAAAARKARELNGFGSQAIALEGYALAKSGRQTEARAMLRELLKLSEQRNVPPTNIAMVYCGLGEKDEAIAWLERAYRDKDPRITFLKIDRMWDDLRSDSRFQDLQRRIGLPQ